MARLPSILGQITASLSTAITLSQDPTGPWAPPQWTNSVSLTLTAQDPVTGQQTAYVFDAIIRAEHEQRVVVTQNPVQTGAALSDHAFVVPPRLTIEIAMSDSMRSYTFGQWASGPSRSVSAFQTLLALQAARNPVQVATRLRHYTNMIITIITAPDNRETAFGLKVSVTFENVLTATVQVSSSGAGSVNVTSAIPDVTVKTLIGPVQANPLISPILSATTSAAAASGSSFLNVASASNIALGQSVAGIGIAQGSLVSSLAGNIVGLTQPTTAALSNSRVNFISTPSGPISAIVSQNNIMSSPQLLSKLQVVPSVSASGVWSSTNTSSIASTLGI